MDFADFEISIGSVCHFGVSFCFANKLVYSSKRHYWRVAAYCCAVRRLMEVKDGGLKNPPAWNAMRFRSCGFSGKSFWYLSVKYRSEYVYGAYDIYTFEFLFNRTSKKIQNSMFQVHWQVLSLEFQQGPLVTNGVQNAQSLDNHDVDTGNFSQRIWTMK